jgi:hypothetical protein
LLRVPTVKEDPLSHLLYCRIRQLAEKEAENLGEERLPVPVPSEKAEYQGVPDFEERNFLLP